jgi:hypothetical protein
MGSQVSAPLQYIESSQAVSIGVLMQASATSSQLSSVQAKVSSQTIGDPATQPVVASAPVVVGEQVSVPVQ